MFKNRLKFCYFLMSIFGLAVALSVELTDNEAYYWSWSLQPSLSYFDHPPLLAWILWISTHIFGKNNFAVRIPSLLSFWTCSYLLVCWMKHFKIPWNTAISICISAPLFFIFSWLTLPDVLLLPLSLLTVYSLSQNRFTITGFCLGFAILSKWHAFLLIPGIVISIFLIKEPLLKRIKILSTILGTALIMQAPVILWNYQNDWVSFKYHLIKRHDGHWGSLLSLFGKSAGFLAGFIGIGGAVFVYVAYNYFKHRRQAKIDRDDITLLSFGLVPLIIFGLSASKGETRIYWAGFALFPFSIFFIRNLSEKTQQQMQKIAVISCLVLITILSTALFLPIGAYMRPIFASFKSYDLRMSPRGDFIGWKDWAKYKIGKFQGRGEKVLFLATNFRYASQLLWNSDLQFDQVSALSAVHQYSIWPRPKGVFSKIIIFGDNRTHVKEVKFNQVCETPLKSKHYYHVQLLSEPLKVIEDAECPNLRDFHSVTSSKNN
jgi:hypothetical protein